MKDIIQRTVTWIKEKSLVNRAYLFKGSQEELLSKLKDLDQFNKSSKFYLSNSKNNRFKITDTHSVGIMLIDFVPIKGITIEGEFKLINENKLQIRLWSKLRIEIYISLFSALAFYILMVFSKQSIPWYAYLFPPLPIPWFAWIYKLQTVGLQKKISSYLKLENNKNSSQ